MSLKNREDLVDALAEALIEAIAAEGRSTYWGAIPAIGPDLSEAARGLLSVLDEVLSAGKDDFPAHSLEPNDFKQVPQCVLVLCLRAEDAVKQTEIISDSISINKGNETADLLKQDFPGMFWTAGLFAGDALRETRKSRFTILGMMLDYILRGKQPERIGHAQ